MAAYVIGMCISRTNVSFCALVGSELNLVNMDSDPPQCKNASKFPLERFCGSNPTETNIGSAPNIHLFAFHWPKFFRGKISLQGNPETT